MTEQQESKETPKAEVVKAASTEQDDIKDNSKDDDGWKELMGKDLVLKVCSICRSIFVWSCVQKQELRFWLMSDEIYSSCTCLAAYCLT
jgi:hypothetical protein